MVVVDAIFLLLLISPFASSSPFNWTAITNSKQNGRNLLPGIELPQHPHAIDSDPTSCSGSDPGNGDEDPPGKQPIPTLKLHLKRFPHGAPRSDDMSTIAKRDLTRLHAFQRRRMTADRDGELGAASRLSRSRSLREEASSSGPIMATLQSGVAQGSGEYFMDVYLGTPPRHFSLILDTGSDLNWIQCTPCYDCFNQSGPHYDPATSSSYRNVSCADPRCRLVASPENPRAPCRSPDQTCPYFYWYGDSSNTTGDLAVDTFTLNLTATGAPLSVDGVLFGCGHWNRGLFHGAAGLLGMGRGPLSFPSQLRKLYGHTFSYCLVDRNSDASITSKLLFGQDLSSELNYTTLLTTPGGDQRGDTFYYVGVKGVTVGGKFLGNIPSDVWKVSSAGEGGTIVDSGTTLSYFAPSAYEEIKAAFKDQVGDRLPLVDDFPVLELCYNVSGVAAGDVTMPEFAIVFADGAVWRFPEANSFIRLDPEEVMCLAMLGARKTSFNIVGNYQQQNFHIAYDTKKSRLGFAPKDCTLL